MPKIKISEEGRNSAGTPNFVLRDESGMLYGTYLTRKLADEGCRDWNKYYVDCALLAKKTKS